MKQGETLPRVSVQILQFGPCYSFVQTWESFSDNLMLMSCHRAEVGKGSTTIIPSLYRSEITGLLGSHGLKILLFILLYTQARSRERETFEVGSERGIATFISSHIVCIVSSLEAFTALAWVQTERSRMLRCCWQPPHEGQSDVGANKTSSTLPEDVCLHKITHTFHALTALRHLTVS